MKIFKKLNNNKNKIFSSIRKKFDEHPVIRFISVIIIIIIYFIFATYSHGIKDGLTISLLTWTFFVLCTPVADAGILIDFPIRLVTGIKMIYSEIIVWFIAIIINIFLLTNNPETYDNTIILSLFKHILDTPFPYWIIIILSGVGTFLSIYIADNIVDNKKVKKKHSNYLIKHKIIIFTFLIILIIIAYDLLLNKLGIHIPLI